MMKAALVAPLLIAIAVIAWMASGSLRTAATSESGSVQQTQEPSAAVETSDAIAVQVSRLRATPITRYLRIHGQVEPLRSVDLRAETSGRVVRLPVARGQRVKQGALLVGLALDDRQAQLDAAKVQLQQRQNVLESSLALKQKGLGTNNQILAEKAALAAAAAELARIKLQIAQTQIHAPFGGVLDQRPIELGHFLDRGDSVATLIDDSRLLLTAQIPQQSLQPLALGQPVTARLIDARQLEGHLTFIATAVEQATRSYRIEVEVPNPTGARLIGLSATLEIPLEQQQAHQISAALLNLDSKGELQVKTVDANNRVLSYPVQIVRSEAESIWITGLPDPVSVISLGQGFFNSGDRVRITATVEAQKPAAGDANRS